MASSGDSNGGLITGINVTPLVDITLVLLIVFVVTAKIIVTPALPLELPKAAQTEEVQVVLSVIVPAAGPTLVNGEPVADASALTAHARTAVARDAGVRAVIHADGRVAHQRVMGVLDALRAAGLTRIAFAALTEAP